MPDNENVVAQVEQQQATPQEITGGQQTTPEVVVTEIPQISLTDFSSKVGREFKSADEVYQTFEELSKRPERLPEVKTNPFIEQISQVLETGGDNPFEKLSEFVDIQRTDFEKLAKENPKEVLFRAEKERLKGVFTDEEIRQKLDMEFPTVGEDGEPDENLARRSLFAAREKAAGYVPELNKLKVQFAKPDPQVAAQKQQEIVERIIQNHASETEKFLNEFKEIKLGDYSHPVVFKNDGQPNATYKALEPTIQNPMNFIGRFMNQDGTPNSAAILKAEYILNEFGNLAKGMSTWAATQANLENLAEVTNKDTPKGAGAQQRGNPSFEGEGSQKLFNFINRGQTPPTKK